MSDEKELLSFPYTGFPAGRRADGEIKWFYDSISFALKASSSGDHIDLKKVLPGADIMITTVCSDISEAPYAGFNPAGHVGDNPENVRKCRMKILEYTGCEKLVFMKQTHSSLVLDADELKEDENCIAEAECDGIVSSDCNTALAVMTADCLPLLLSDPVAGVFAAVHCGWKGLAEGITGNAVSLMCAKGAERERIFAYAGPAIGPHSFEVGEEIRDIFTKILPENAEAFAPEYTLSDKGDKIFVPGKYMCNIYQLAGNALAASGVDNEHFEGGIFDTFLQKDLFYSYRRSNVTGRTASVIFL